MRETLARLVIDVPDYPEPGVVFKDITPVLADHAAFTEVVEALAAPGRDRSGATVVDYVIGMEARGFILAAPVALALGAGFVPVRKAGKLPRETYAESYSLEYGQATLEMHRDALEPGARVLLVDDVLATGGTVAATVRLVEKARGRRGGSVRADGPELPAGPRGHRRPAPHEPADGLGATWPPVDWGAMAEEAPVADRPRPYALRTRLPLPAGCGRGWPGWARRRRPATRCSSRCSGPCGPTTRRPTWRCWSART